MKYWTTSRVRAAKGTRRLACVTAYDAAFARLVDDAGIAIILVGDSLGNNILGYENTIPVTMADMLHHTAAVTRVTKNAMVIGDMPFLSYQVNDDEAMHNAGRFLQEANADAVKLEGGASRAELVRRMTDNGIPVCAHIGLTPQSVLAFGGYKMQGKLPDEAARLLADAKALAAAGAFAVVIECVPAALGKLITEEIDIPTIGIGAGSDCDAQILVQHDLFGINPKESTPRFAKRYAELGEIITSATKQYVADVENKTF